MPASLGKPSLDSTGRYTGPSSGRSPLAPTPGATSHSKGKAMLAPLPCMHGLRFPPDCGLEAPAAAAAHPTTGPTQVEVTAAARELSNAVRVFVLLWFKLFRGVGEVRMLVFEAWTEQHP